MKLRDKYGYPVERIKGRPFTNFMRCIFQCNPFVTWKRRKDD